MYPYMDEREAVCPVCHNVNIFAVDHLPPDAMVCCSKCGAPVGRWSETHERPREDLALGPHVGS